MWTWIEAQRAGLPSPGPERCCCWRRGVPLCPKAGAVCKREAADAAGPFSGCPTPYSGRPPAFPLHPRLTAVGTGVHSPPGPGRRIPKLCRGLWPAFCETHTGLRKRTLAVQGELLWPAASLLFLSPLTPQCTPLYCLISSLNLCSSFLLFLLSPTFLDLKWYRGCCIV